jgi:tripartite-type tricarboxylate transporter receptor subunit TctC
MIFLSAGILLLASVTQAAEDSYPTKPVRIVVPWPAGSVSDSISRLVAERAAPQLGVPVVVENKPGAASVLGADYVAKSRPDGYIVLHGNASHVAVLPATGAKLPFDPVNDLAPITLIGHGEMVLVTPSSLRVSALPQLIALAKSRPGGLTYGTTGMGSNSHFAGALLTKMASIEATEVTYKGNNEVLIDLIGGRLDFAFDFPLTTAPHVTASKLRALMVTSPQRVSSLPDVPTASELGFRDLEIVTWGGYFVPARTPPKVADRLNAALVRVLNEPEVRTKFRTWGLEPAPTTVQAFAAFLVEERARWQRRAQLTGIRVSEQK